MSVKLRLGLIGGIPLVFLVLFASLSVVSSLERLRAADAAQEAVRTAAVASALIAEIQRERGLSAAYLSARGESFADRLAAQRTATDGARAAF
ncbi:MAG: nitrate- and nitrite sensing domain-containing protein, partial [Pseudomonadota bacterium]